MQQLIRVAEVAGFIGVLLLSGTAMTYMLISPRAWFRLPRWIRGSGSLTEKDYSSGWGAIKIRITGAIGLTIVSFMLYAAFIRHR